MKRLWVTVLFAVICGFLGVEESAAARPFEPAPVGSERGRVEVQRQQLSVSLREVPLDSVLEELRRATGATFEVQGVLPATITESFDKLPVEKGLRRLFGGAGVSLLYEEGPDAQRRLVRVWIFPRSASAGVAREAGSDAEERLAASIQKATSAGGREERWQAIGELANSREKGARDALLSAMRDPEPDVRERAIDALGDLKDEAAVGPLSRALTQDEDEDVRESAADALGEIPSAESVAALKRSLEDESPDVRESAVYGLARIGGPEIIPTLRRALSDEDEDVRDTAAESLRKLAGGGAVEPSSGTAP